MTTTDKIEEIISAAEEALKGATNLYMELVETEAVNDLDDRRFHLIEDAAAPLERALDILNMAQGVSQRFDKEQQQAAA